MELRDMVTKFRAWDVRNSKMVEDALILSERGQLVTVNADYFNSPFSFFDGCIWMQYVGVKDKNGKETYEGDIIMGRYGKQTVRFYDGGFHPFCGDIHPEFEGNYEVIGNIYENPELLKRKTNETMDMGKGKTDDV